MALELDTRFDFNSLVWICLLQAKDQGPSHLMIEDVAPITRRFGVNFDQYFIESADHLEAILIQMSVDAKRGKYPIIHFDAHGSGEAGLDISSSMETFDWPKLASYLRQINISTRNNLCVIGTSCFGLQAVSTIDLNLPTPFFILLAPEKEVKTGYLEDNVARFYGELFTELDIDMAYHNNLAEFKVFHCEELLVSALARYISGKCKGKGGRDRRGELLTKLLRRNNNINLREARKMIQNGLKPTPELLDKYAATFLMGRISNVKIEDIVGLTE